MRFREIIIELFDPKLAIDLEWAEGSDYIAARGYVTVTNPDGYGGEYGNEEEVELEVEFGEFPHRNRKEYEVQFKVGESYDITGGGNANVIFATVIQACKDFVEMYHPDRLFFTAKEQSRARMYDTLAKRVAKQVGWHVIPFDEIQKDPLYRNRSDNGFVFVIDKGAAPEKWSSAQKPQHGSFMPIFYVYNVDKDTPTVAVKVRAPNRETAVQHAMKIEPSFKDLDLMQIHALNSLPKREVTAVKDGGTAGKDQTEMKVGELFGAQDAVNNSVKWSEPNDEYVVADFTVGNMKYRFNAYTDSDEAPGVWEIEFESLGGPTRFGINQTGRSAEVFTVVANIIKEFISKKNSKIKRLTFAAKEGSRQNLYLRMVRRLVPDWKFEFDSDDGGFILTKPRPKRVAKSSATAQVQEPIRENFADGKNPQDKGDSKRHGVPTKASVSTLRKVAKQGGRKGQLAHWMANMKAGKAKKS
jgi:hypothetical protein